VIVLDTNVISEMMREHPAARVLHWLRSVPPSQVHTTIMCKAEVLFGIALLGESRRKRQLRDAAERIFAEVFRDRVLGFDDRAAEEFASIYATRERTGRRMQIMDGLIAGIVRANKLALATRDVQDFADCGIEIVNPWNGQT